MGKYWTEEEKVKLKEIYPFTYSSELKEIFKTSRSAIFRQAKKLNLKSNLQSTGSLKYSFDENFFSYPNILNSYWAGFIAADGCIHRVRQNKKHLSIQLHEKDIQHLEKFRNQIKYTGTLLKYQTKTTPTVKINLYSDKLCEDLYTNFNITSRKSLTLEPPKNLTKEQTLAFIIGYIDGDGCITHASNANYLALNIVGTKKMLSWIFNTLIKLVENYKIPKELVKKYKNKPLYYFGIYCSNAQIILEILNKVEVPKLERKWERLKNYNNGKKFLFKKEA